MGLKMRPVLVECEDPSRPPGGRFVCGDTALTAPRTVQQADTLGSRRRAGRAVFDDPPYIPGEGRSPRRDDASCA